MNPVFQAGPREPRTSGFTVLELLAVICVLAILATLLIPVVGSYSDRSKGTKCLANLRQAGILVNTLIADSGNKLYSFYGGVESGQIWSRQLMDKGYLNQKEGLKVLRCPYGKTQYPPFQGTTWYWESYGMQMYREELIWTDKNGPIGSSRWTTLYPSRVSNPSNYLLLADSAASDTGCQSLRISKLFQSKSCLSLRHQNKANGFFLDGHMEQLDENRATELGMESMIYFEGRER